MKEISIEMFKSGFENIADLVVSLNKEYKVILKPRDEIEKYLESKPPYVQSIIIKELIEVYDYGAISEFNLNNDSKEYRQKIPFDVYLKFILKSAESQIKYEQFVQNDKIIKNIKDKLEWINSKSAKINYLLERKQILEGDYPEEYEEILTKDPIYLFISRQLEYWREYNEISNDFEDKPLRQLSINLTFIQRTMLFKLLVANEFIPDEKEECFIWALGKSDEERPEQWQPIVWLKNKQLLRELLTPYKNSKFIIAEIERIVPLVFADSKGNPFTLTGNRPVPSSYSDQILEITKKIATF